MATELAPAGHDMALLMLCAALGIRGVCKAAEAEGWQDAGPPAPHPERLNVFPTSAARCPLLVVNLAHFVHPDGGHRPACELTEPQRPAACVGTRATPPGCVLS